MHDEIINMVVTTRKDRSFEVGVDGCESIKLVGNFVTVHLQKHIVCIPIGQVVEIWYDKG